MRHSKDFQWERPSRRRNSGIKEEGKRDARESDMKEAGKQDTQNRRKVKSPEAKH